MASIHFEELQSSEMYSPFPSSPEQVAVFSPGSSSGSEDDQYFSQYPGFYFSSYEQNGLQGKMSNAMVNRQKRRAVASSMPMNGSRQLKRDYAPPPVVCYPNHFAHISEAYFDSGLTAEGFAPAFDMSSSTSPSQAAFSAPSPATPLSCDELVPTYMPPSSGRIKSTTPNLGLLFSLFNVLESYCEEEVASSPLSQASSPCYSPSRSQRAPEARSPPAQVPELLSAPSSRAQAHYYPSRHYEAPSSYHWAPEQDAEYDQPLSSY